MGYTTDFNGHFEISPPLNPDQIAYLKALAETRRMARNADIVAGFPDPKREAVGLPIGPEGAFFVGSELMNGSEDTCGGTVCAGQAHDDSITNYNGPPSGQPGLWLQWTPNEDGSQLEWDWGEKFYDYVEWLAYMIENFFEPWGRKLNGEVDWVGEDSSDRGTIHIKNNKIQALAAEINHPEPVWNDNDEDGPIISHIG